MRRVALLGILLMAAGCCSNKTYHPAVREFRLKNPEEFRRYTYLYPTTLPIYMGLVADRIIAVHGVIDDHEKRFQDVPGIQEFAQDIKRQESAVREKTIKWARELERLMGNDGAICQFEWSDGYTSQVGLLILRNGRIVWREVWFEEIVGERPREDSSGGRAQRSRSKQNVPRGIQRDDSGDRKP